MVVMKMSSRNVAGTGVLLLLFLLPFAHDPWVFNPYEFPKFAVFVFGVWAIGLLHVFQFLRKKHVVPLLDVLGTLVLLFGAVSLIADVIGLDPRTSFLGSVYRRQGFVTLLSGMLLFFLVRSLLEHEEERFLRAVQKGALVAAIATSLIALWHAVSFYLLHNALVPIYQGRIVGTFGNPNFLGGYLVMVLPFILLGERVSKTARTVAIVMILAAVFVSFSRSAWLATLVVLGWGARRFYRGVLPKTPRRCISIGTSGKTVVSRGAASLPPLGWISLDTLGKGVLIVLFGAGLLVAAINAYWFVVPRVLRLSMWDNRMVIWSEGTKAVIKRPILGYGQENFSLVFPEKRFMYVDNAHNIFLETAVSSGLIGFLLFMAILTVAIRQASWPVRMSLIAFLITAQFNPLSIAQLALFWFLLGFTPSRRKTAI